MEEFNMNQEQNQQEPMIYKELSKEQKKALNKEFQQTSDAKKLNRIMLIFSIVMGALVIAIAIISIVTKDWHYSPGMFPVFMFAVFPAMQNDKFIKWLKTEKNILMKRPKVK